MEKIDSPVKINYVVHNKLLQINEIKSWVSNYEYAYRTTLCQNIVPQIKME